MFNFQALDKRIKYVGVVVIITAIFGGGFFAGKASVFHVNQPGTFDMSLFWDSYNKLQQNFVDPSKIDNQKIEYGAIEGMAQSTGDPYTEFFDPTQAKSLQDDLNGSFSGVGMEVGIKNNALTVIAPLEGTPAQLAGIKSGDIITKINGKDASNLNVDQAVNQIRGTKGTTVTLTMYRTGWSQPKDFTITRDTIKSVVTKWSMKGNDIAYIQIFQFDQTLSADFKTVADQITKSSAKKIVLDLRDNPGGYLEVAQDVAGYFLQNGQTVTIEDFGGKQSSQTYKAEGNDELGKYPVVVLMNQGSASASEILAGSLRDNRGVQLVGTQSFGKGSVQTILNLEGGSELKITIAHWLTPKGNSISEVGLTPDVKSTINDTDIQAKKDPQLDKALEIINKVQ